MPGINGLTPNISASVLKGVQSLMKSKNNPKMHNDMTVSQIELFLFKTIISEVSYQLLFCDNVEIVIFGSFQHKEIIALKGLDAAKHAARQSIEYFQIESGFIGTFFP